MGLDDDRPCDVGLFSCPDDAGRRTCREDFASELRRQQQLFDEAGPSDVA